MTKYLNVYSLYSGRKLSEREMNSGYWVYDYTDASTKAYFKHHADWDSFKSRNPLE